jgi:hypothetical protein
MGHDSEHAAIIYLHETHGADLAITAAIDDHMKPPAKGTARARHDSCPQGSQWHARVPAVLEAM